MKRKNIVKENMIEIIKKETTDKATIKKYVQSYYDVAKYIRKELLEDKFFCEELLIINGLTLKFMPESIKKDKALVILALNKSSGFALKYADKSLRADIDVVKYAILRSKKPLRYASEDLQIYFKEKWKKYYDKHPNKYWKNHKIVYNGIRTSKEEMERIIKEEKEQKSKKKKSKQEQQDELKKIAEDEQITFSEYDFEENDRD